MESYLGLCQVKVKDDKLLLTCVLLCTMRANTYGAYGSDAPVAAEPSPLAGGASHQAAMLETGNQEETRPASGEQEPTEDPGG